MSVSITRQEGETEVPRLIVDVDGTLTIDNSSLDYTAKEPRSDVIERVNALHAAGVRIVLYSARNMRTYAGNIGLINKHTLPVLIAWLAKHGVRYDEIHMGKPWCGHEGFYVKLRSMRPDQFLALPMDTLRATISCGESDSHGT